VAVGVLALTAGILVAGAPGPWQRTHAAVQGVGVGGGGDVFTPAALTVTAGDSVTWTWAGGKHSVTSTSAEPFDSGSLSAGSFSHTFATAGTFSYLCVWHSGMTGSITVLPAAPAAPAAGTAPAASTPGATGVPQAAPGPLVARPGRPRLAGVGVSGRRLRFRLNESATVVALAFRPHAARGIRIGRLVASPGKGTLDLRLDRLHPGHHRLVVRATDTGGQRSKASRVGYLLTHRVWQRAVDARGALANTPPAAPAVPPATAPIAPPAVAPAVTGAGAVPPPSSDDDEDHGGDDGNRSGSGRSGGSGSG
jgi:plastocyanin